MFNNNLNETFEIIFCIISCFIKVIFNICDPQRVQTVHSWLLQGSSSFVDAKVADHILAQAKVIVKTAVHKNLKEPEKHFKSYGDFSRIIFFFLLFLFFPMTSTECFPFPALFCS